MYAVVRSDDYSKLYESDFRHRQIASRLANRLNRQHGFAVAKVVQVKELPMQCRFITYVLGTEVAI